MASSATSAACAQTSLVRMQLAQPAAMEKNDDWGALSANFELIVVPDFAAPAFGTPDYPWAWSLNTAFPLVFQRIGHKKLVSGSSLHERKNIT